MKLSAKWNSNPYIPYHYKQDIPYIVRIAPAKDYVEVEWRVHGREEKFAQIKYRERGAIAWECGQGTGYVLGFAVSAGKEYEVRVECEGVSSLTRLVRAESFLGTVINYLHPEDNAYSFSGRFLGSPSIVRLKTGRLVVSMDVFQGSQSQNFTTMFYSDDEGKNWRYLTDLMPCFWGTLFEHGDALYMIAASTEYGDIIVGRSDNGGADWGAPVTLMRGAGNVGHLGCHKAPVNIVRYNNRLAIAIEWGCWRQKLFLNGVLSNASDDLLQVENWHFGGFSAADIAPNHDTGIAGAIEGCLMVTPEGRLVNIARYAENKVLFVEVEDYDSPASRATVVDFPLGHVKFDIKKLGKYYYAMGNEAPARNRLAVYRSADLRDWEFVDYVVNKPDADPKLVGFQYPTYITDESGLAYAVVRTADCGAANFHDSNAITFHIINLLKRSA